MSNTYWKTCRDKNIKNIKKEWKHFAKTGACGWIQCKECPFQSTVLCVNKGSNAESQRLERKSILNGKLFLKEDR